MGLATFIDGIHPHEGRELSENKLVQVLMPKDDLVYPMSQHAGAPTEPLVTKDDHVLADQKIGEAGGLISANVAASVSGIVKATEPRRMTNGAIVSSIVVGNDGEYRTVEDMGEDRDPFGLSKEEIHNIVKETGVVGPGGAGFLTYVKLTPKDKDTIEYILIDGAECEPYLTSNYQTILEEPGKIVGSLKVILQLFSNVKGVVDIENNKPEAIRRLTGVVKNESRITVCPLMTKHPQEEECSLIYAATGGKVNSSILPADAGCIMDNIDTVISIYMTVCKCMPLMRRIVTATRNAVADPRNFNIKLGIDYQELPDTAGGFKTELEKALSDGPMMSQAIFDLDIPVSKALSALTCLIKDQAVETELSACIRYGKCVSACPDHIIPVIMMQTALKDNCEIFEKLNGMECMECGSCTYICPAKRPLTQAFKEMCKTIAVNRKKRG